MCPTRSSVCLSLLLACAACGGGGTDGRVGYRSGTRLRARVLDVGDARAFVGFHDRQLDVDCTFALAEDGVMRCLPDAWLPVEYTDAACTTPVGEVEAGACALPTPKYATTLAIGSACGAPPRSNGFYILGAAVPPPSTVYEQAGACNARSSSAPATFYALTPVPSTTFVAAQEERVAHGSVGTMRLVGEDGSSVSVGLYDAVRGQPCTPLDLGDGGPKRCLPESASTVETFFADPQCTQPLTMSGPCPPAVAVASKHDGLCTVSTLFAVGDRIDPGTVSEQTGGGCEPIPIDFGDFYSLGAAIAPDAYPAVTDLAVGTGPVRVAAFDNDSGSPLDFADGRLVLADTGHACVPFPDQSNTLRCFDESAAVLDDHYFADASCTQPAILVQPTCRSTTPSYAAHYSPTTACGAATLDGAFALGAPLDGAFVALGSGCVAQPAAEAYAVGAPLDLAVIPALEAGTE